MREILSNDSETLGRLTLHRRALHAIAELSGQEFLTQNYVFEALKSLKLHPRKIGTGVVADVRGKSKDLIAFRADMDALPIQETSKSYQSKTGGVAHMCGHDGHMAILLTFAECLSECRPHQSVRLIFQPSEERGGGAEAMIGQGVLENVRQIFGFHLCPEIPENSAETVSGAMFAGAVDYQVEFEGSSAHVATAELAHDALRAAMRYIDGIEETVSSEFGRNSIHRVGLLQSGTAHNIIPGYALLKGTYRYFDDAQKEAFVMAVERELVRVTNETGVDHRVTVISAYPPLINSTATVQKVRTIAELGECGARYTAEDFAFYLEYVDGAYMWLGIQSDKHNQPLHSARFDFDEQALIHGVEIYTKLLKAAENGDL